MTSVATVFAKTAKGREEMQKRTYGINPQQRRVLIIIDGIKDMNAIEEMIPAVIPAEQRGAILSFLVEEGFIELVNVANDDIAGTSHAEAQDWNEQTSLKRDIELTTDPAAIRSVKDFMTTTANTYLGLLAADVIQRIERAKTAEQLMSVVGVWHMALHDSQQGRKFASSYLEQVTSALTAEPRNDRMDEAEERLIRDADRLIVSVHKQ